MRITLVAGARPNFMKIAPILHQIQLVNMKKQYFSYRLVHTGQHYDEKMSQTFFQELNIPEPNVNLACGGGTQAEQTAAIMVAFEKDLVNNPCDLVLVVGDVTSTMACAIVARKSNIRVAHIEAGIRSFDNSMPEEINRLVTDSITNYFFTTSKRANENLLSAGIESKRIFFVGNVMIDTLLKNKSRFFPPNIWHEAVLENKKYVVLTLHRPSNVDNDNQFELILTEIMKSVNGLKVVFPVHPRTRKKAESLKYKFPNLWLVDPLGYLEFNYLVENAIGVVTDSGGITEETTVFGIPCITLRENTERPETVEIGTNLLIGNKPDKIGPALNLLISGNWKRGEIPEFWDGKSAERIIDVLISLINE